MNSLDLLELSEHITYLQMHTAFLLTLAFKVYLKFF